MLISYNWLKKHVNLPSSATPEDIAQRLTLSTVEVEGFKKLDAELADIVVGRITTVEKHPNADRLKICTVDSGNEKLPIVCGGSNVQPDMLVAVAKIGARVRWHGEGDLITLEPTTIRGVASRGMICGADEIGLDERFPKHDDKEIVDLTTLNCPPGTPLSSALGLDDTIFEIDNKALSNRPDLWGHYGLARELSALYETDMYPGARELSVITKGKGAALQVQAPTDCLRYLGTVINGLTITESPAWLKTALTSVGIRPINTIVDITNYVMLDLGQPLHAFDLASIPDHAVNVRHALPLEPITLLDGATYTLDPSMLVIAATDRPLALAGIMGGLTSAVTAETKSIFIEAATFDATSIRRTASKLGLRTEASMRFEKSLDPHLPEQALAKALELIAEICPTAQLASKPTNYFPESPKKITLPLERHFINTLLGTPIPEATIESILTRLGFTFKIKKTELHITVPSWRATKDIRNKEDIAEEIGRIYGYHRVPAVLPFAALTPPLPNPEHEVIQAVKHILVNALRLSETPTYSFVSKNQITLIGDELSQYLELANPLSQEKPYLRRTLLPNLLEIARLNLLTNSSVRLYEIGRVFRTEKPGEPADTHTSSALPEQHTFLTALISAENLTKPFFETKRALEYLARVVKRTLTVSPTDHHDPWHHPGRAATIKNGEKTLGSLYELHPALSANFDLPHRAGVLELDLTELAAQPVLAPKTYTPSAFPTVERDLTFLVQRNITHHDIIHRLVTIDPLLITITLIDHFEGEHIPTHQKSLTYRFSLSSYERTLTKEDIERVIDKIRNELIAAYQAELR